MVELQNNNQIKLQTKIYSTRKIMGACAAKDVADKIVSLLKEQQEIRMIFAAAPSQNDLLANLIQNKEIDWSRITAFHMDEYLGLEETAPQRFGNYLKDHIFGKVTFKQVNYLNPAANSPDEEIERYSALLKEAPIDIICMGIGENGHIAFNDPPVADFNDPDVVKVVELDQVCRQQQVNDGCFETIDDVPEKALTLTIPTLYAGKNLFIVVPGPTKAKAVHGTLSGIFSTNCPASILTIHSSAILYLDKDSAKLVNKKEME